MYLKSLRKLSEIFCYGYVVSLFNHLHCCNAFEAYYIKLYKPTVVYTQLLPPTGFPAIYTLTSLK